MSESIYRSTLYPCMLIHIDLQNLDHQVPSDLERAPKSKCKEEQSQLEISKCTQRKLIATE